MTCDSGFVGMEYVTNAAAYLAVAEMDTGRGGPGYLWAGSRVRPSIHHERTREQR